ncbi:MAG TPA: SDR family NAD(P)-dependent oxidoreductase [Candidatus Sulfopaludibacter sp.]|jgi:short-subunit dehydrogenase|nr:SDR family NAD(P)-dependent oxidoreductase [Candidatus Sulfopaludibacter sp.]
MKKTIVVCGFGTGISDAVANKFSAEGFQLALVARSADKLEKARSAFQARGVEAAVFPTDLADPNAAKDLVQRVKAQLGPITAIHWNAYTSSAGDVLTADAAALRAVYDLAVTSLVFTVREALADLKAAKGAVLVTNGGLGLFDPKIDAMAVQWNSMGVAIANAAKHKLVGLLSEKLRAHQITVGEVVVNGLVKGTSWDTGSATIEPETVAARFWEIYSTAESKVVMVS